MIAVNGQAVDIQHFPDGTQLLKENFLPSTDVDDIVWKYENDEELVTLIFLSKHLREKRPYNHQILFMWYVPNARMDRTKKDTEVFTLKYFCDVINSLGFSEVCVLDPHSNVTPALIKNVRVTQPDEIVKRVVVALDLHENDYVYFPDDGAAKRYADLFPVKKNILIGHKKRDWSTGQILGLEITGRDGQTFEDGHFMGCKVLMIDDIISYGGTLAYSADELKKLGFKHIYAYATHVENSILDEEKGTLLKRLNDSIVDHIYTTDSIYRGKHPKITAFVQ